MTDDLTQRTCHACEGFEQPMDRETAEHYREQVEGWELNNEMTAISKEYEPDDFQDALQFVNDIGEIAESEGHHPDIRMHSFNKVTITLSTHAIGGLSQNDFIVAAKIDDLTQSES